MADGANDKENVSRPQDIGLNAAVGMLRTTGLRRNVVEVHRALSEAVGLDRVTLLEADALAGEVRVGARWPESSGRATPFDVGCALPLGRRSLADLLHGRALAYPDLAVNRAGEATEMLRAEGFRSALYIPIPDHLDGPVIIELASRTPSQYNADTAERFRRAFAPPQPSKLSRSATGAAPASGPDEREAALARELYRPLSDATTIDEAVKQSLPHLGSFAGFHAAAVRVCEGTRETIWVTSEAPLSMDAIRQLADATERILREIDKRHAECTIGRLDLATGSGAGPAPQTFSHLADGLLLDAGVEGSLVLATAGALDEDDRRLLTSFSVRLATALRRIAAPDDGDAARLRAVTDLLEEGLLVVRGDLSIEPLNRAGRDIARAFSADDTLQAGLASSSWLAKAALGAIESGEPHEGEIVLPNGDGSHTFRALLVRTAPEQALVAFRDVSEQRILMERMVQSEKLASIGKLVSGVAHELNNPLTAVMGFAQVLLARDLDERTRQDVQIIMDEAERASHIVENLLAFARRRPSEKLPLRIDRLIERVIELRTYDIGLAGIEVELDLDPNVPPVLADLDQMQQVLLNMIINAEQAIRDSGRRGGRIWVRTWVDGDRVKITLADSGPGVAQENLLRVFDPFFTTRPVGEGTGLGLSICYGIVAEHGGHISVENRAEGGACFMIELPVTN